MNDDKDQDPSKNTYLQPIFSLHKSLKVKNTIKKAPLADMYEIAFCIYT